MKRALAVIAVLLLVATAGSLAEPFQFRINVAVDLVNINFSATDKKGRMIPGLTANDFVVEEDGKPQTVTLFSRERELPLTLGMLIDISPSVAPVFDEEKRTAAAFIRSVLGTRDLAMVISFDRRVTLVQDYSEDTNRLTRTIEDLQISNFGTSLFDAVYLASNDKLAREAGRKAIVVISDGDDSTSKYDLGRALIAAQRSDVVVYAISINTNPKTLRTMAEETGGAFFRIRRNEDFQEIFDRIALELRTQYSLAYHSTNTVRDGKYRRIRIIPRDTSLQIRARRGYYAPQTP